MSSCGEGDRVARAPRDKRPIVSYDVTTITTHHGGMTHDFHGNHERAEDAGHGRLQKNSTQSWHQRADVRRQDSKTSRRYRSGSRRTTSSRSICTIPAIYDAQYLAGLIADEAKMTKKDLKSWLAKANCVAISGSTVAWVAAESKHGWDLAMEWIESKKRTSWLRRLEDALRASSSINRMTPISTSPRLKKLLERVEKTIHEQPNHVRYGDERLRHRRRLLCEGTHRRRR